MKYIPTYNIASAARSLLCMEAYFLSQENFKRNRQQTKE
jgi:hypothetical protein